MKDSVFEELTKTIEKQNAIMLKLLRDNTEKENMINVLLGERNDA